MQMPPRFNKTLMLGILNEHANGCVKTFVQQLNEKEIPANRQAVYEWLKGTSPRVKTLFLISKLYNHPMESFFLKGDSDVER